VASSAPPVPTGIRYVDAPPDPADYNRLRRDAGWPEMDPTTAAASLPRSCFAVCAHDGDRVVGMGRVVGDGGLCFYVQDVIVLREYQGRGIGAALMDRLMAHIAAHAVASTYLGLMSAVGKEAFYRRWGFISRPTGALGCGMTRFWGRS
jgi:GNAT superfamily N-acetyltransferase